MDTEGTIVCRRQLRRSQVLVFFSRLEPCLVGMEACAGAHYWARELTAVGHEVQLMPPAYVKPGLSGCFAWTDKLPSTTAHADNSVV